MLSPIERVFFEGYNEEVKLFRQRDVEPPFNAAVKQLRCEGHVNVKLDKPEGITPQVFIEASRGNLYLQRGAIISWVDCNTGAKKFIFCRPVRTTGGRIDGLVFNESQTITPLRIAEISSDIFKAITHPIQIM